MNNVMEGIVQRLPSSKLTIWKKNAYSLGWLEMKANCNLLAKLVKIFANPRALEFLKIIGINGVSYL